jgi:hypothetical protein
MYKLYIIWCLDCGRVLRAMQQFIITKKVAKHGSQAIIVVPRILEKHLKPNTIVRLTIDVIELPGVQE